MSDAKHENAMIIFSKAFFRHLPKPLTPAISGNGIGLTRVTHPPS
jgi:hypothetical protein